MSTPLRMVVTGASGFLGRLLVRLLRRRHFVIAIERRIVGEAELADHPNVEWHQLDLADADAVSKTFARIRADGGAQVLIHLAAYYDFTGDEVPEYQRTNVDALRLLLEASRGLGLEHFVFASSVAACRLTAPGQPITEATPPDGTHIYARTKRAGELMLADWSDSFSPVIVRFAALFSDWCEYPPLQVLLDTWTSKRWDSRILAGRGETAIPYLHVRDAGFFMMRLLEQRHELEPMEVLIAGDDGAVSHRDMYRVATAHLDGRPRRAIHLPRPFCRPGIWLRDLLGRAVGSRPFERPWMADYVDRRMEIDAGHSRRRLGWSPTPRLRLLKRLPFMIEHARDNPMEWYRRNREAAEHLQPPTSFRIYSLLRRYEARIEQQIGEALLQREAVAGSEGGPTVEQRFWDHRLTLRNLLVSVRTEKHEPLLNWCRDLAERRVGQGFNMNEVVQALRIVETITLEVLRGDPESVALGPALDDTIRSRFDFGVDQVLEVYEDAAAFGLDSRVADEGTGRR